MEQPKKSRRFPEEKPKSAIGYSFGGHEYDVETGLLAGPDGASVQLRSQSNAVLAYLARRANNIVDKDDLIAAVWADRFVTDDSLIQCISEIRKAIGDSEHKIVQTFAKKGYRLNAQAIDESAAIAAREPLVPGVAVLAFEDISHGDERGHLSDAISEGIIGALSHFGEFSVMARSSSFKYRGQAADAVQIGVELGALYVLEGSQQKDGNKLRVTAQLIDTQTGQNIWSTSLDRTLEDAIAAQSEIVQIISASVGQEAGYSAPRSGGLGPGSALRYHLKAREYVRAGTVESLDKAEQLNNAAIEAEPTSGFGYIGLAWVNNHRLYARQPGLDRDAALSAGRANADQALLLAPKNYWAHLSSAVIHIRAGELDLAFARVERALELNPSATNVSMVKAGALAYRGQTQQAVELAEYAMATNPAHFDWYFGEYARMLWENDDNDQAYAAFQKLAIVPPGDQLILAVICADTGHLDRAGDAISKLLAECPGYTIRHEREFDGPVYEDKKQLERWLGALRRAGLPE